MEHAHYVRLFRNGRNQALRIPRELELKSNAALIYKEGERLVIEPVKPKGLLECLSKLSPLDEDFPDIDSSLAALDDINL